MHARSTLVRSARQLACIAAVCAIVAGVASAAFRTWTDSSGQFSIEAELVEVDSDAVKLKKRDGTTISIPKDKLSATDRAYLANLGRPSTTAAGAGSATGGASSAAIAGTPATPSIAKAAVRLRAGEAAIEQALARRVANAFEAMPLVEALSAAQSLAGVPILLDRPALNAAKVDLQTTVSSEKNIPLRDVLAAWLDPHALTWLIRNDVLYITTKDAAKRWTELRLYLCARTDLQDAFAFEDEIKKISPDEWTKGGPAQIRWLLPIGVIAASTATLNEIEQKFAKDLKRVPSSSRGPSNVVLAAAPAARAMQILTSVQADRMPLKEVLSKLAVQAKIPITIDEAALGAAMIDPMMPLSVTVSGVKFSACLDIVLREPGLTYAPTKAGIEITTPKAAQAKLIKIVYPSSDLLGSDVRKRAADFSRAICGTIDPPSWSDAQGPGLFEFDGEKATIDITQTLPNQLKVDRFFNDVRDAGKR